MNPSSLLIVALTILSVAPSRAATVDYYIGVDTRPNVIGGTYDGLANPNNGRLSFLFAHTFPETPANNHYHGIGVHAHTGPNLGSGTAVAPQGTNFQLPETFQNFAPMAMTMTASGLYNGRLSLQADPAVPYSDLHFQASPMLAGFAAGTPEQILYNSSTNRWTGDMLGAVPALQLISLTTGLNIGSPSQLNILSNMNDTFTIGSGNTLDFRPIFWADPAATAGNYSARFRLVDLRAVGTPLPSSGEFVFNLRVIPEPGSALLAALTLCSLFIRRHRAMTL